MNYIRTEQKKYWIVASGFIYSYNSISRPHIYTTLPCTNHYFIDWYFSFSYYNYSSSLYIVSRNISMASAGQALNRPTLPAGYRFSPNNDDLIVYYLKRKILGQQLPADVIPTTDVYASSPDKLPLGKVFSLLLLLVLYLFITKKKVLFIFF